MLDPTSTTPPYLSSVPAAPIAFLPDSASTPSPPTPPRALPQPQPGLLAIASSTTKECILVVIVLLLGQSRVLYNSGKLPRFEVASRSAAVMHGAATASLLLQGLSQTLNRFFAAVLPASEIPPPSHVISYPLAMTKLPDTLTGYPWSSLDQLPPEDNLPQACALAATRAFMPLSPPPNVSTQLGDVANVAHPPRGNTSALQGILAAGDELRSILLTRTPFQQSWADVIEHYDALAFEAAPESLQQVDPVAATVTFRTLPFQPRPLPPLTASHAFPLNSWPSIPFTSINTASKRAY
jgi:hypothetical protein